ncbi:unnamed protein product, partial [Iphiclides podalirius]
MRVNRARDESTKSDLRWRRCSLSDAIRATPYPASAAPVPDGRSRTIAVVERDTISDFVPIPVLEPFWTLAVNGGDFANLIHNPSGSERDIGCGRLVKRGQARDPGDIQFHIETYSALVGSPAHEKPKIRTVERIYQIIGLHTKKFIDCIDSGRGQTTMRGSWTYLSEVFKTHHSNNEWDCANWKYTSRQS